MRRQTVLWGGWQGLGGAGTCPSGKPCPAPPCRECSCPEGRPQPLRLWQTAGEEAACLVVLSVPGWRMAGPDVGGVLHPYRFGHRPVQRGHVAPTLAGVPDPLPSGSGGSPAAGVQHLQHPVAGVVGCPPGWKAKAARSGTNLHDPQQRLADPATYGVDLLVSGYDGTVQQMAVATGVALRYWLGQTPVRLHGL